MKGIVALLMTILANGPLVFSQEFSQEKKNEPEPWGTVKGRLQWGGKEIPDQKPLKVKNPGIKNEITIPNEKWIVNPRNKGLKDAIVWLAAKEGKLPIHLMLQKIKEVKKTVKVVNHVFVPHVLGIREGQVLEVTAPENEAHNFVLLGSPSKNPDVGRLLHLKNVFERKDLAAEPIPIILDCNVHYWMRTWVGVFDNPYFATTDSDGHFEIPLAPAGQWQLMTWHPSGGWLGGAKGKNGRTITIQPGNGLDLGDVDYPPPMVE